MSATLELFPTAPALEPTDAALEQEIDAELAAILAIPAGRWGEVRPHSERMCALIKQRSARRIKQMEIERGLRR